MTHIMNTQMQRPLVLTLINEKGGVGKSTMSVHIAAGLAIMGKRVLIMDADAQGHAGKMLGLEKEPAMYDLLVRNAPWQQVVRPVSTEVYEYPNQPTAGKLFIVPSNIETRNIATSIGDAFRIERRLKEIKKDIDVVIFDTSPTPSLLHGIIYLATDMVLYPTKPEVMSFDGLVESLNHLEEANETRDAKGIMPLLPLGIVPNLCRKGTLEHDEMLTALKERYGALVWDEITLSTIWPESARLCCSVWNLAPDSRAALDAWKMVKKVHSLIEAGVNV